VAAIHLQLSKPVIALDSHDRALPETPPSCAFGIAGSAGGANGRRYASFRGLMTFA
jgi:hypothetical protein